MHDRRHKGGTFRWQTLVICGVIAITALSLLKGLVGVLVVLATAVVYCYWRDLSKREHYRNDLREPRRRSRTL